MHRLPATLRRPAGPEFAHPGSIQPLVDFVRVESEQMSELDVRDASFGDQSPHVARVHAEPIGGHR